MPPQDSDWASVNELVKAMEKQANSLTPEDTRLDHLLNSLQRLESALRVEAGRIAYKDAKHAKPVETTGAEPRLAAAPPLCHADMRLVVPTWLNEATDVKCVPRSAASFSETPSTNAEHLSEKDIAVSLCSTSPDSGTSSSKANRRRESLNDGQDSETPAADRHQTGSASSRAPAPKANMQATSAPASESSDHLEFAGLCLEKCAEIASLRYPSPVLSRVGVTPSSRQPGNVIRRHTTAITPRYEKRHPAPSETRWQVHGDPLATLAVRGRWSEPARLSRGRSLFEAPHLQAQVHHDHRFVYLMRDGHEHRPLLSFKEQYRSARAYLASRQ